MASLLMLATLPGRTQGLGLITEPLLKELQLGQVTYAQINLWATLLGAAACLPMGWLIDRYGLRLTTGVVLILLSLAVWQMSAMAGGAMVVFVWVLVTRALGQSALSVASITTVGKSFGRQAEWPMGVYAVLLTVFLAFGFVMVGHEVRTQGWREAWMTVALGVGGIAVLTASLLRELGPPGGVSETEAGFEQGRQLTLFQALSTRTFWVFASSVALFGLISSGIGLFNEAVLAECGFTSRDFHYSLGVMTAFSLVGQLGCGGLARAWPTPKLLGGALIVYAAGLAALPRLSTWPQLWMVAAVLGMAAGAVMVIFFAIWGRAFGGVQLGRIQGAAQLLTVLASALGPLLFAAGHDSLGSYQPLLTLLAGVVLLCGVVAWRTQLET